MFNPYAPPVAGTAAARGLAGLHGRLGRLRYLLYLVLWFAGLLTLVHAVNMAEIELNSPRLELFAIALTYAALLALLACTLILSRRRCHDIGRSGWWCVLLFVGPVLVLMVLVLLLAKGESQANAFGAPPERDGPLVLAATVGALAILGLWLLM